MGNESDHVRGDLAGLHFEGFGARIGSFMRRDGAFMRRGVAAVRNLGAAMRFFEGVGARLGA
jgi:hypothetical protein